MLGELDQFQYQFNLRVNGPIMTRLLALNILWPCQPKIHPTFPILGCCNDTI